MATTSPPCFLPIPTFSSALLLHNPAVIGVSVLNFSNHKLRGAVRFGSVTRTCTAAAGDKHQGTKPDSLICADCDGNGAVLCSQCKGGGVNKVDYFNGQFKAGESCWLCGGKKDMLCGNCNGAGFVGGFMSGFDH